MFLRKKNELNIWQSVSDLMTGLVIIFLFISILYVAQSRHVVYQYKEVNNQIYEDLMSEFTPEELNEYGAEIDKNELVIRFQSDKLFANNEKTVNQSFKNLLEHFWPRFAKIALNEKYADDIKEIRIEGQMLCCIQIQDYSHLIGISIHSIGLNLIAHTRMAFVM